jgi:RNA polymerase sigma-70 factor (ECF subfamily)
MSGETQALRLKDLIDRLKAGDLAARDALLAQTFDQLTRLARAMLRHYPGVHRWSETDDILQAASLRLYRALSDVTPPTPRDFFRLAAAQIRRELRDMARKYAGPHGLGANFESHDSHNGPSPVLLAADDTYDPARLADWSDLHSAAESLPDHLRPVFDLIFYQGLSQDEAADVLGVTVRTIKRHWREARFALHDALGGRLPGV